MLWIHMGSMYFTEMSRGHFGHFCVVLQLWLLPFEEFYLHTPSIWSLPTHHSSQPSTSSSSSMNESHLIPDQWRPVRLCRLSRIFMTWKSDISHWQAVNPLTKTQTLLAVIVRSRSIRTSWVWMMNMSLQGADGSKSTYQHLYTCYISTIISHKPTSCWLYVLVYVRPMWTRLHTSRLQIPREGALFSCGGSTSLSNLVISLSISPSITLCKFQPALIPFPRNQLWVSTTHVAWWQTGYLRTWLLIHMTSPSVCPCANR